MLTQKILKELLDYDPLTGVFRWRVRDQKGFKSIRDWKAWTTMFSGGEAGCLTVNSSGKKYISIRVCKHLYYSHRLAWLYMTGSFPGFQIDHIDGCGTNNIFLNLRDVTSSENHKNHRLGSANTSGFVGVCWHKKANKWEAKIQTGYRHVYLGLFSDIEDAISARQEANVKYGFHANHGSKRPL